MDPHVYITYRHIVAGLAMLPFAYFLERKPRPKLTIALLLEIFVLALVGVSLTLNMYFVSLNYTSPTLLASMVNTIAALTFVLAVILRGIAKVVGTLVSLAGFMSMTLYKGPVVKSLGHPLIYIHRGNGVVHENWSKSLILTVASCITWSVWYIMQCTEQKGPVFVTVFNPLSTVLVAVVAYFVLGEKLYTGSIIGAVIVIIGLYLLLWGTEDPQPEMKNEAPMMQIFTSDQTNLVQNLDSLCSFMWLEDSKS
ncbi:hypothetical protein KY285_007365 [Solanum tuberosum]|nr:hypothetical protein KY285_007365 [Solanum tuberosum]